MLVGELFAPFHDLVGKIIFPMQAKSLPLGMVSQNLQLDGPAFGDVQRPLDMHRSKLVAGLIQQRQRFPHQVDCPIPGQTSGHSGVSKLPNEARAISTRHPFSYMLVQPSGIDVADSRRHVSTWETCRPWNRVLETCKQDRRGRL